MQEIQHRKSICEYLCIMYFMHYSKRGRSISNFISLTKTKYEWNIFAYKNMHNTTRILLEAAYRTKQNKNVTAWEAYEFNNSLKNVNCELLFSLVYPNAESAKWGYNALNSSTRHAIEFSTQVDFIFVCKMHTHTDLWSG